MNAPWFVYLLECADSSYYCGITLNLQKRLDQHNGLLEGGARYTSGRRPVRLAASLRCRDKSAALRLERTIKKLPKNRKPLFFAEYVHAGS